MKEHAYKGLDKGVLDENIKPFQDSASPREQCKQQM